jgi:hypothetical protein
MKMRDHDKNRGTNVKGHILSESSHSYDSFITVVIKFAEQTRNCKGQENAVSAKGGHPKMKTKKTGNYANCAQILLFVYIQRQNGMSVL